MKLIPEIRKVYERELDHVAQTDQDKKRQELNQNLSRLRDEEVRLGRLLITGKMTEEAYEKLRLEWLEKIHNLEASIKDLERQTSLQVDDLEVALALMSVLPKLFTRLGDQNQAKLLRILAKAIIVNPEGEIVDFALNSPFMYLLSIKDNIGISSQPGSNQVLYRPHY